MGSRLGCARRAPIEPLDVQAIGSESSETSSPTSEPEVATPAASEPTNTGVTTTLTEGPVLAINNQRFQLTEADPPAETTWTTVSPLRLYVVWVIPGYQNPREFCGLHWGEDLAAYSGLLQLNGTSHLGGLKWKRVYSLAEGESLFVSEASRHLVERTPIRRFRWQFN